MSATKYEQWDREWCDPLRREVAKLEAERDHWKRVCEETEDRAAEVRAQLAAAQRERDGWHDEAESRKAEVEKHRQLALDPWHWMGNGEDHLETLVCPVLIMPSDLRRLLSVPADAELDRLVALAASPLANELNELQAAAITALRRRVAELTTKSAPDFVCEACQRPADGYTVDDVPLCNECGREMAADARGERDA